MKSFLKYRSIRNSLLTTAAVTAMTLPLLASASIPNIAVSYDQAELNSKIGQQRIYNQLKSASRRLCGSTDIRLVGSLRRSNGNEQCYEGTLTAAVQRLDNDGITALHNKS
jgi:UrcA family protein